MRVLSIYGIGQNLDATIEQLGERPAASFTGLANPVCTVDSLMGCIVTYTLDLLGPSCWVD